MLCSATRSAYTCTFRVMRSFVKAMFLQFGVTGKSYNATSVQMSAQRADDGGMIRYCIITADDA